MAVLAGERGVSDGGGFLTADDVLDEAVVAGFDLVVGDGLFLFVPVGFDGEEGRVVGLDFEEDGGGFDVDEGGEAVLFNLPCESVGLRFERLVVKGVGESKWVLRALAKIKLDVPFIEHFNHKIS